MVAHQNLGGKAIDQRDAALRVRPAVEQVACIDEGVFAGAEPPVVERILNELRVTMSV